MTAIDADFKTIFSYMIGDRNAAEASYFKDDLRAGSPIGVSLRRMGMERISMRSRTRSPATSITACW